MLHLDDVTQISIEQFTLLKNGDVVLVRSTSVKELGDHFVVITGPPVLKTNGLRPETLTLTGLGGSEILDMFKPAVGVTALLLNNQKAGFFRMCYNINLIHGTVLFSNSLVVDEILKIFEDFRLPPTIIDQYNEIGRQKLFNMVLRSVNINLPIKFSMLGYPFKSKNTRDKVIGEMPDLGEELSLANFNYLNERIKMVYLPGAEFSIVSDGYIFSDVWGIPNSSVQLYYDVVCDIGKSYPIKFFKMADFYPGIPDLNTIREKIVYQFGISPEVLQKRILTDMNVNTLYKGMIIFMTEENAMKEYVSGNQRTKNAKALARTAMFRNEAYSALMQNEFGHDHIRLSMHNSTNDGTKYSIRLIHDGIYKYSPWHSCIAKLKDGSTETLHRKDAVERNYELIDNYYFQEV